MTRVPDEFAVTNARIVLADAVMEGAVLVRNGLIADISEATAAAGAVDFEGDYLIPGLVELHTDHLEKHYAPRVGVRWNAGAAVLAHDTQLAGSGITTVFDALRAGMDSDAELQIGDMLKLAEAIEDAASADRFRADHYIHLRCEISAPDCIEAFSSLGERGRVRLVSLMDHAPGQRQFQDMEAYRDYFQRKLNVPDDVFQSFCERRVAQSLEYSPRNRQAISDICRRKGIPLASHDDATAEHVAEAVAAGIRIAEFPTTLEAARASHAAGLSVLMGAPNLVRGGSHSGNVAARDLAEAGYLDILSSDYIPFSLIQAAFRIGGLVGQVDLPRAIAMVSRTPARAAGFDDRGEIAPGKRADLVRVRVDEALPVVRAVWRQGQRVS